MMVEILYTKRKDIFGYYKISAIKNLGHQWGASEKFSTNFGIIELDLNQGQINQWSNKNKWCVNDDGTSLVETPAEYQAKEKKIKPELPEED